MILIKSITLLCARIFTIISAAGRINASFADSTASCSCRCLYKKKTMNLIDIQFSIPIFKDVVAGYVRHSPKELGGLQWW